MNGGNNNYDRAMKAQRSLEKANKVFFTGMAVVFGGGILLALLYFGIKDFAPSVVSPNEMADTLFHDINKDGHISTHEISPENVVVGSVGGNKALSVLFSDDTNVSKGSLKCSGRYLPSLYKADSLDEAKYVVLLHEVYHHVGQYTNGKSAYRKICEITIIDRETGDVVFESSVSGTSPPSSIGTFGSGIGGNPSNTQIENKISEALEELDE